MNKLLDKEFKNLELLQAYNGTNPYIITLKNNVLVYKNTTLNAFSNEYLLMNYDKEPRLINKMVKLADWFGESKEEEWGVKAEKLLISYYMGETSKLYHVYGKYRRSQEGFASLFIPKEAILTDFLSEDYNNYPIDFLYYNEKSGRTLKPHQERGVKFLLSRKKAILSLQMGGGKSYCAIVAALEGKFEKILVICPASVKTTWKEELEWLVPNDEITIVEGSKWKENKFTIINYDILDNFYTVPTEIVDRKKRIIGEDGKITYETIKKEVVSRKKDVIDKAMADSQLFQSNFDLIIIDEAHMLSNSKSIRYKVVSDLIKRSNPKGIFELTGTPLRNNPSNLFQLLRLIDAPIAKDWGKYALRYCGGKQIFIKGERDKFTSVFLKRKNKASWYDLTYEEKKELNEYLDKNARKIMLTSDATNLDELQERIKHLYLRETDFGDALTVKKETKIIEYDLDFDEEREYREAWNKYIEAKGESDSEALRKLTDNKKLIEGSVFRQMTARFMVKRSIKLAEEYISKGDKVIIFCCFDAELYALQEYFGDRCVIYNGKMNAKQKDEARNRFMNDNNCVVFVGNIIASNTGLTLIAANHVIFSSFSFTPSDNNQASYRILRIGQTKDCTIDYQVFRNTYMERMMHILDVKNNIIENVIINDDEK